MNKKPNKMKYWINICAGMVIIFGLLEENNCDISNQIPNYSEINNSSSNDIPDAGSPADMQGADLSVTKGHVIVMNQSHGALRSTTKHEKIQASNLVRNRHKSPTTIAKPSKNNIPSHSPDNLPISTSITPNHTTDIGLKSEETTKRSSPPDNAMVARKPTLYPGGKHIATSSGKVIIQPKENACPPELKPMDNKWRKGSSLVISYLPRAINTACSTNCKTPIVVHRSIYIQEGDSIKMMLSPSTRVLPSNPKDNEGASKSNERHLHTTSTSNPSSVGLNSSSGEGSTNNGGLLSNQSPKNLSEDASNNRSKIVGQNDVKKTPNIISSSTINDRNSLIIWQVTPKEWESCSTREGGQIADSVENGTATIKSSYLIPGTTFLIGRSSWSSSECYKMKVTVRPADCGEGSICSGKGICFANATMNTYDCSCCHGYIGSHCQERDACHTQPCMNAGICIDIQEGHDGASFQCICAYGFRGQFCDEPASLCTSSPCKNGGSCIGNHTSFSCICQPGTSGTQCQDIPNDIPVLSSSTTSTSVMKGACSDGECVHGVCVQTSTTDFRCFCQPGYGGNKCEIEYNECFSQPCMNGGACMDNVGSFQCICGSGFTGQRCEIKVDFCDPNPCPKNRVCVPGVNSYSCECSANLTPGGCSAEDHLCTPNPCANGGTCSIVSEVMTYFCVCRPGFTDTTCKGITHSRNSGQLDYPYLSRSNNQNKETQIFESVGTYGTLEPVEAIDPKVFLPTGRTRMKNFYTAAVTLSCAFLIVIFIITACHLRIHGTMCRCCIPSFRRPFTPSFSRMQNTSTRDKRRKRLSALRLDLDDGASVPMTPQGLSETVYCNAEVCDNQDVPLMRQ